MGSGTAKPCGGLLDFVTQDGGLFEVFRFDGFSEPRLQKFQPIREIAILPQGLGHFAHVACALVHGLEEAFQRLGKSLVALWTAKSAGLLKIRLGKSAAGAAELCAATCLLDFLRGTEAQQEVRERKAGGVIYSLCLRALLAKIHLLHFVLSNLGEVDGGFSFLADAAQHNVSTRISARPRVSSRNGNGPQ